MLMLFVILQDDEGDKEGRIGALTACVGARDTTLRDGILSENSAHLCANYTVMNTDFLILPQYLRILQTQFAHISVSYIILSILNVTISRQTTIKFRQSH